MIIQTTTEHETKVMAGIRDSLRAVGMECYLVPKGVECIYVTLIERDENSHDLVVKLQDMNDDEYDMVVGFEDCTTAYEYAETLGELCGVDPMDVWGDVQDGPGKSDLKLVD